MISGSGFVSRCHSFYPLHDYLLFPFDIFIVSSISPPLHGKGNGIPSLPFLLLFTVSFRFFLFLLRLTITLLWVIIAALVFQNFQRRIFIVFGRLIRAV